MVQVSAILTLRWAIRQAGISRHPTQRHNFTNRYQSGIFSVYLLQMMDTKYFDCGSVFKYVRNLKEKIISVSIVFYTCFIEKAFITNNHQVL